MRATSRRLLTLALVAAVAVSWQPLASAQAQQSSKVFRIGFLCGADPSPVDGALRDLGYIEGKNAVFEVRATQAQPERAHEQAADLVRAKVDVIVAFTNMHAFAAKAATSTIPIVVFGAHAAAATGLVASLARPGGNVTGIESLAPELDAKRMQLLKEIVPALSSVAALYNPADQGSPTHLKYAEEAAHTLGVRVVPLEVKTPADFNTAFSALIRSPVGGLLTFTDNLTFANWQRVADYALKSRLPTVCEFRQLAESGCLVSYGPSFEEFGRRVASQVDRVLKGAKPADLPVEQATRFELVVNLKTAKAIGITVPRSVLVRVHAVIE